MSAHDSRDAGGRAHEAFRSCASYAADADDAVSNGTFTSGMTNPNHLLKDSTTAPTGSRPGIHGRVAGLLGHRRREARRDGLVAVVTGAKQSRGHDELVRDRRPAARPAFATNTYVPVARKAGGRRRGGGRAGLAAQDRVVGRADAAPSWRGATSGRSRCSFVSANPQGARRGRRRGRHDRGASSTTARSRRVPALAQTASPVRPWWMVLVVHRGV
jgi:hypothetical protein